MKLINWLFCLSFIGISISHAEETILTAPEPARALKTYSFMVDTSPKTPKKVGKLTLTEEKKGLKLEFEGFGLKTGQYKVGIADQCQLPKGQKKLKFTTELHPFNTQSGEIYSEEFLTISKIDDLNLEGKSIVLIKVEKQKDKIISCAIELKI